MYWVRRRRRYGWPANVTPSRRRRRKSVRPIRKVRIRKSGRFDPRRCMMLRGDGSPENGTEKSKAGRRRIDRKVPQMVVSLVLSKDS